jgi:SAM-dependent methyltransferase
MGMLQAHIHLLAMEQGRHPIAGKVLTLGQQSVYGTVPQVENIFRRRGVAMKPLAPGFDTSNKIPAWKGTWWDRNTNAQTVLTLMGAKEVVVTDVSDYEGATLLLDLNNPVARDLDQQFDVILDIGTIEHIYDVPAALENLSRMLKVGGQLILILPASNAIDHGFYCFSPTLLYDYFKANGFDNFDCYLRAGRSGFLPSRSRLYKYNRVGAEYILSGWKGGVEMAFFATRTRVVEKITKPIQSRYANSAYWVKSGDNMVSEGSLFKRYKKIAKKAWEIFNRNETLTYLGKL